MRSAWSVATLPALVLVLLLSGCTGQVRESPRAQAAGLVATVTVSGEPVPFLDLQRWTTASIATRNATALTVFAVGAADQSQIKEAGGPCGPPILRLAVEETARSVTVFVGDYQQPADPSQVCPAVGYGPSPYVVRLHAALGTRALLDGSTGKSSTVLDGSDYPDLPSAPAAWGPSLLEGDFPLYPAGIVTRLWSLDDHGQSLVFLESKTPQQVRADGPSGAVVQHLDLYGTTAAVYKVPGTGYLVQWQPNPRQVIALQLTGPTWTQADAARYAAAVTGYRTERTDRLAQPPTPGTVAAEFNSADGPVTDITELIKSSKVHIALDCIGAGTVDVTVRNTNYPFTCTTALSHHLAESHGSASQAFTVSVHAGSRTRWALTLARASLDGS